MKNIAIIGGGISGMVASINIKNKLKDSNVYLIEKEDHLGGRLYQENHIIVSLFIFFRFRLSWIIWFLCHTSFGYFASANG